MIFDKPRLHITGVCAVLVFVTFLVFGQTILNDFVYFDDDIYVTGNENVQSGLTYKSVLWAFTSIECNWHPLTWLSHMVDYELYGSDPAGHHLTSLLFHIANGVLLFIILRMTTGAIWPSAFAAAVFVWHPLRVESVAWVAERKDVLSGFFWMLTVAAYIGYCRRGGVFRYILVVVMFCFALMCKPMVITLPFVLVLLDYWPLRRILPESGEIGGGINVGGVSGAGFGRTTVPGSIIEKTPLFFGAIVLSVVVYIAQSSVGATGLTEIIGLHYRFGNAMISYCSYIGKMIYPVKLAVLYPLHRGDITVLKSLFSGLVVFGVSLYAVWTIRVRRYFAVGWFWYLGMLVPVIGFIQVGSQAMADRYTYLPLIGLLIIAGWGLAEVSANWKHRKLILGILASVVLLALSAVTQRQLLYWKDRFALYDRAVSVTRDNVIMHGNYGIALVEVGEYDKAIEQFEAALRVDAGYWNASFNLGVAFLKKGWTERAIALFEQALRGAGRGDPIEQVYCNLGVAYAGQGRYELASANFRRAVQLRDDYDMAWDNMAMVSQKQGKSDEAIEIWQRLLSRNAGYQRAHYNLGLVLAERCEWAEAIGHMSEALRLGPDDPYVMNRLAFMLATAGGDDLRDGTKALMLARRACELTHYEKAEMLDTLAAALAENREFEEAVRICERSVGLYKAAGDTESASEVEVRLGLYMAGEPYRAGR